MKTYHGRRHQEGSVSVWVEEDGHTRALEHYVRHSPTGFEWGYAGSGPSDLALALLTDVLGEQPEPQVYMQFKFDKLTGLGDSWDMTEMEIRQAIEPTQQPLTELEWGLIREMVEREFQWCKQQMDTLHGQEREYVLELGRMLVSIRKKIHG